MNPAYKAQWKWKVSHSVVFDSLWPHELYSPWNSPGQSNGRGSRSLLQGIFPTQGSNPCLPHCRQILYRLSHQGNPRILEWVAYPFSSGSSWPRNQTGVSCIAGGFFTSWTTSTSGRWHLSSVGIKGVWVKGKRKCVMQDIQQFIAPPVPYAAVLRDRITASKTPLRKREGSTQLLPHSSLDSQLSKNYGDALL